MRSGRESANNNPDTETVHSEEEQAMKSPPARRIQQEREKSSQLKYRKNSSPIPNLTSSKVSSSGDAEMYSMFDNIEAILNNGGGVDGKDDNHHVRITSLSISTARKDEFCRRNLWYLIVSLNVFAFLHCV